MLDITGQKFGRLTALEFVEKTKKGRMWRCLCDCGNEVITRERGLLTGHAKSCGCRRKEFGIKHGGYKEPYYSSWRCMMGRCYNKKNASYSSYGARGIKVCIEWHDFKNFSVWALSNGFEKGLTIDRINPDSDYCPENCKWSTQKEQARNKRNTLTFRGESLASWAEKQGLPYYLVYNRTRIGWSIEEALGLKSRKTRHCDRTTVTSDGKSIGDLSEETGLPYNTIYNRINILGWSVEKAISTPIRKYKE